MRLSGCAAWAVDDLQGRAAVYGVGACQVERKRCAWAHRVRSADALIHWLGCTDAAAASTLGWA